MQVSRPTPLHPEKQTGSCRRGRTLAVVAGGVLGQAAPLRVPPGPCHLETRGLAGNRKRVQRLWREEGLKVPSKSRKRSRTGDSDAEGERLRAESPGHVWALDYQHDQTVDGRNLRLLNVVDEHTRQVLASEVARSFTADTTVAVLESLAAEHGPPAFVRMDNGPEFTAGAIKDWCRFSKAGTAYIDPGSPWQNAYVESLNGRIRDELLDRELFHTLHEAKVLAEDWRIDHNENHPHSALGMMTPNDFAANWRPAATTTTTTTPELSYGADQ